MRQILALTLLSSCLAANGQTPISGYDFRDSLSPYLDTNPPHVFPLTHRTGNMPTQPFGPTTYASAVVGTTGKRVANFTAPQFFRALHGMNSNGGGSYVNMYSIVYDVKFDSPVIGTSASLFNTNQDCGDDAESFVRWDNDGSGHPLGKIGISGVYAGSISPDTWHRIVVTVDSTVNFGFDTELTYYVDGVQANQLEDPGGLDGRWSAYGWGDNDPAADYIDIFGDDNGQNGTGQISLLVFFSSVLNLQQVTSLGPVGTAINFGITVPPTTVTVNLGKITSGNVASLAADDGNLLNVCKFIVPNLSSPIIQILLDGTTTLNSLTTYAFKTKAKMLHGGSFKLTGEVYNFVGGVYDNFRTATPFNLNYSVLTVPSAALVDQYRGAGGALRSRLKVNQTGPAAVTLPCTAFEYSYWVLTGN